MRRSSCPECNGALDPDTLTCPTCSGTVRNAPRGHDREIEVRRGLDGRDIEVGRRWKLHVPWGLFLLLGLYAAAAYGYLKYADQTSPATRAEAHLIKAERVLGADNGESASTADLYTAYRELVAALKITPEDAWGHRELGKVSWALAQRNQQPPADLKRDADFLAASWQQIQASKKSQLPESPRDRFGIDGLEDRASRLPRYFGLGGVIIILLWMYREFQDYKFMQKRDDEHEVLRSEELSDLDAHRRRR